MSMTKRFTAFVLALIMMLGCVTVVGYADDSYSASIDISMGKVVNGEWTEVTKVNPGEEVTARITLTTSFPCGLGNLLFFYDADFYVDEYESPDNLDINPAYLGAGYNFSATVNTECGGNTRIHNKITNIIGSEKQEQYNWIYVTMDSLGYYNEVFDGSKYLFDINLKVKPDASGKGYLTVLPETISTPASQCQFFNLTIGDPSQLASNNIDSMYDHQVDFSITPEEGDYTEIATLDNGLVITTKFFRQVDGQWVETDKAERGENLKARVYLDSDYPTSSGELMFFYDGNFFTHSYGSAPVELITNTSSGSFTAKNNIDGYFYTSGSSGAQAKVAKMVSEGYISQPAATQGYFYVVYEFGTGKTNTPAFDDAVEGADAEVDNDLWFCEFDLKVAEGDDVPYEGDLVVDSDTITTASRPFGAINVPMGYEDNYDAYGMWLWDANVSLYSTPVSINSKVTFKLDGGKVDGSTDNVVIEDYIGESYDVPEPTKENCTFLGWYEDGDATQTVVEPVTEIPYDEITYVAKWGENVTVIFKDSDDDTITYYTKTGVVGDEFPVDDIENPTKSGYGFARWSLTPNGAQAPVPSTYPEPAENETTVTYYACWETNTYPIKYVIKNEVTGATTEITRNIAYQSEIPTDGIYDVPEGYTLDGWYNDEDCTDPLESGATMPAEAKTVYAKLKARTYTVTFILDGGKIGNDAGPIEEDVAYMGAINAPGTPVKDHYDFAGWTPDLQDGAVLDTPEDRTYTATWEVLPYTINYYLSEDDKEAGTVYETGDYLPDETVDSVADPHVDGQTFDSWTYYNHETGAEINFTGTMPAHDVDAVAVFEPIEYTLTIYHYEEGKTDELATKYEATLAYGDKFGGSDTGVKSPEVEGFELVDSDQEYVKGTVNTQSLDNPDDPECTTITVNVYYKRIEYTITWNLAGGKIGDDEGPVEQTYAYGANVAAPDDPTRTGYEFAGWQPDQIPATMPADDTLEFTAQWTPNQYNATFYLEGGELGGDTGPIVNPTDYDANIVDPADPDAPTRAGYTFQGWSDEPEGNLVSLGTMDNTNGKEFYAIWLADNASYYIDVYYMNTDGNYDGVDPEVKAGEEGKVTGDQVSVASDAYVKTGFTFDDSAANVLDGEIPATGELRLKVYYARNQYPLNITYVMSDNNNDVKPDDVVDEMYYFGEDYSVSSPDVTGYDYDIAVVEGTMDENGKTATVTYSPKEYALNITYVMSDGKNDVKPDDVVNQMYAYNTAFSVDSPTVTGYTPDVATVSGTMDENGKTVTVTYTPNNYPLNITYVMSDGNDVVKPANVVNEMHAYNTDYSVTSPPVTGYTPDIEVVEGTMDDVNGKTATVTYSPNAHTITWKLDGGKVNGSTDDIVSDVHFGDTVSDYKPANPEKYGYSFDDWTPALAQTVPDDNLTYTATYTPKECSVKFVLNGGKYNGSEADVTVTVNFGDTINPLDPAPTKEGSQFLGWSDTDGGTTAVDPLGTMDTEDGKIFYAIWSTNSYALNITYVMSDGNNDVKPDDVVNQMVPFGEDFSVDSPAVTGYKPDIETVSGTMDADGESYTVTYSPNEYTLTVNYEMTDGHNELAPETHNEQVAYNTAYSVPSPDVTGYTPDIATVSGTMDDATGKTATVKYSPVPCTLTIHYVYADGTEAAPDATSQVAYNAGYSVPSPEITGYSPDTATVTGTMNDVNGVEVTVKYTAGNYPLTINYEMTDGHSELAPAQYTENYAFGSSYSVDSPTVVGYTPDVATVSGTMDDVNGKTATVKYSPNPHTVKWKLDGGNINGNEDDVVQNVVFGDTITAPADPEKEGYTFSGWNPAPASTVADEDYEYTAQWTVNKYPATFKLEGGKYNNSTDDVTVQVEYDAAISPLDPAPTRDGYTFEGWTDTEGGIEPLTSLGNMGSNGKTFYAIWTADNAAYYTEIYRMGTDGTYPATYTLRDSGNGDTDDHVSADPADYEAEGFTFDSGNANNVLEGDIPATGSLTLKLYYKRDQHNAIFMSEGSEFANDPYYYEQAIEKPANEPEKEHNHFLGWSATEGGTTPLGDNEFGTMGTGDVTFYAIFEPNTYDIIYKFDGAKSTGNTNTDPADIEDSYTFDEIEYGQDIPTINDPVSNEAGYSFIKWVWYELSDSNPGRTAPNTTDPGDTYDIEIDGELRHGTKIAEPTTVPENDVLAVALFKAPGKAMFYYGKDENGQNDSTRLYDQTKGADGEAITPPATDPTIDGYNFLGWCERGDDGQPAGDVITDFGNYETGNDKKFVAKWKEIPAYANFHANEGEWPTGDDPVRVQGAHSQAIEAPADEPTRTGYTFNGWGDSATATDPVDSLGNYDKDNEKDFYAIWEQNITNFDANGGTITVDGPSGPEEANSVPLIGYNKGDIIGDQAPTPNDRPGYTFEGWFTQPEGGDKIDFNTFEMPGGEQTVYAHWKENGKQNINYRDDEGNLIKAVPVIEGTTPPALGKDNDGNDIDPSKPGKEFVGWVDENGDPATLPDTMSNEPIDVYAKYNDIDYTLTFDPNGGSWGGGENPTEPKEFTHHYGDSITEDKPADPVAPDENHYFAGWSLDGTNVVNVESTMPAKDLTYKAVWKVKGEKHTVTYKDSDGTVIETKEAEEGKPVPKISDPSRPGYIFTGWKWTNSKGKEIDTPYTMPNEDITATATYSPIRPTGSGLIVVGHGSARDGSPNEYGGEYSGEYAAPGYSMKAHIDAARPAEKPAENHGEAIPQTGSNETAAIFAIVSAAAAAAYVVFATKTKKKEDED